MFTIFMRKSFFLLSILCMTSSLWGQHQELQESPNIWKGQDSTAENSNSLWAAFKKGTVQGHFRYFLSLTDNALGLTDYHANAAGGGLRFETNSFHNLTFAVSGFYVFDVGSSNLALKDPLSNQPNRYEIGLFDVSKPESIDEISRLEEFYIKYERKDTKIKFGRQLLNTPFINLQDGRMRPSAVSGMWVDQKLSSKHNLQAGWLYSMAPRGTSKWYSVAESIGFFPSGVNPDGSKSDYINNLSTNGIGMAAITSKWSKYVTSKLWDVYIDNILNTTMLQVDIRTKGPGNGNFIGGLQSIYQQSIGDGGNSNPAQTYVSKGSKSLTFGAKAGWKNKSWDVSSNFNRITSSGRYLMPREWGRDPFFTFMPRERNEGFGDMYAYVLRSQYTSTKYYSTLAVAYGYFDLPDPTNYELNKYGMPSYTQLNIDLRHQFKGFLKGFEGQVLWVSKWNQGNTHDNPKYIINKVDMNLLNVVLNFRF